MDRGHQERLAPLAQEVMARAGLAFADLDRIAVTLGPGSFTGLRVGLAFAKGLGLALDRPVIGLGETHHRRLGAYQRGERIVVIAMASSPCVQCISTAQVPRPPR
jgi:tRNA threonylcarbamoyladenosine biosynthesis protein TsaB